MSYRRLSSNFTPQVAVIATQDSTVVQFLPPKAARELFEDSSTAISIRQLPAVQPGTTLREPLSVVLNRGEVYQLSGPPTGEPEDLTGTLIPRFAPYCGLQRACLRLRTADHCRMQPPGRAACPG
jgi:hypothetical protein